MGGSLVEQAAGAHVRRWRTRAGVSQLRVALECGVSTRHLSFVETGRARASRQLLVHLAGHFEVSHAELNLCLLAAGYAPVRTAGDAAEPLTETLELMLDHHNPSPAFVFDADWRMRRLNAGGQWLCSVVMPEMWATTTQPDVGMDMIEALAHPGGLLSRVRDPARIGADLVAQLRLEQLTNPKLTARVDRLEQTLSARFGGWLAGDPRGRPDPASTMTFDTRLGPLSYFTVQGVVGIPEHVTGGKLRTELWYPADARTRAVAGSAVGTVSVLHADGWVGPAPVVPAAT